MTTFPTFELIHWRSNLTQRAAVLYLPESRWSLSVIKLQYFHNTKYYKFCVSNAIYAYELIVEVQISRWDQLWTKKQSTLALTNFWLFDFWSRLFLRRPFVRNKKSDQSKPVQTSWCLNRRVREQCWTPTLVEVHRATVSYSYDSLFVFVSYVLWQISKTNMLKNTAGKSASGEPLLVKVQRATVSFSHDFVFDFVFHDKYMSC